MATGIEIETLRSEIAGGSPKRDRAGVAKGLSVWGEAQSRLKTVKGLLDTVVTDAAAAGQNDYELEQIQADWSTNLIAAVNGWNYEGKTGINALAQLIADLSEQAGLEGGANRLRLFKGPPGSEAIIAVAQDA